MNDSGFIAWAQSQGLECGLGSPQYTNWLKKIGVCDEDRRVLSAFTLKSTSWELDGCYLGSVWFYDESTVMTHPDSVKCLAQRIFPLGACNDGDQFAVDLTTGRFEVGFLDHEKLWSPGDAVARPAFLSLPMNFTAFHEAIQQGAELYDYYSAKRYLERD